MAPPASGIPTLNTPWGTSTRCDSRRTCSTSSGKSRCSRKCSLWIIVTEAVGKGNRSRRSSRRSAVSSKRSTLSQPGLRSVPHPMCNLSGGVRRRALRTDRRWARWIRNSRRSCRHAKRAPRESRDLRSCFSTSSNRVACRETALSPESPCKSLRVRSSVDEKLGKGALRVVTTVGIPIGNVLEKLPVERVPLEPSRKLSVLDVRPLILSIVIRVARIDDDVAMRRPNERVHVGFEHPVFHQVVDHVERKRQVGLLTSILAHEGERLRRVTGEQPPALAHCCLTHVVSGVHRVSRQQQLVSVATTKFHDRPYPPCRHEGIDHFGLERCELSVGADTRISFRIISILPIFSGSREGFRRRAHCRQPPIKFSGQVSEHQSLPTKFFIWRGAPAGA